MTPFSRQNNLPVVIAFAFSILLNAGGIVFLQLLVAHHPGDISTVQAITRPDDDLMKKVEKKQPKFTPGIENGAPATITWIGYDEYEKQLARQAEIEQAAFTMADAPAAPPVPPVPPTPPVLPTPTVPPTPTPAVTTSAQPASVTPVPSVSPTVNATEQPDTDTAVDTPNALSSEAAPRDSDSSGVASPKSIPEPKKSASAPESIVKPAGKNPAPTDAIGDDDNSQALVAKRVNEKTKPNATEDPQPLTKRPTPLPDFKTPIKTHDPVTANTAKSPAAVDHDVKSDKPTIPQKDISSSADKNNKPIPKSTPPIKPDREPSPDNEIIPSILPPIDAEEATAVDAVLADKDRSADSPAADSKEDAQPSGQSSDTAKKAQSADDSAKPSDEREVEPVDAPLTMEELLRRIEEVSYADESDAEKTAESVPQNPGQSGRPSPEPRNPKAHPSDKETSATSVKPIPEFKWNSGKPLAVEGMEIKPYSLARHILVDSKDALFSINGWEGRVHTNPIVSLRFDQTGKVARIRVYRKSGYGDFDRKYLVSWLSRWTAYDKRLSSLKKGEYTNPILIKLIFIKETNNDGKSEKNENKPNGK